MQSTVESLATFNFLSLTNDEIIFNIFSLKTALHMALCGVWMFSSLVFSRLPQISPTVWKHAH